jgi:hypothetical protein
MAATTLRPDGWSGASRGVWNNRANVVVDRKGGVAAAGSRLIDTLGGDDVIQGQRSKGAGLEIPRAPRRANLQLGNGADSVTGISGNGEGIANRGFLYTGPGDDRLTGVGGRSGLALHNRGFIFTQSGRDQVDIRQGGIGGGGFVDLGADRDTLIGFGNHLAYGGGGKNTLLLPRGEYTLKRRSSRRHDLEKGNKKLELVDFKFIGSIDGRKEDRIEIDKGGIITVKDNGNIIFQ